MIKIRVQRNGHPSGGDQDLIVERDESLRGCPIMLRIINNDDRAQHVWLTELEAIELVSYICRALASR